MHNAMLAALPAWLPEQTLARSISSSPLHMPARLNSFALLLLGCRATLPDPICMPATARSCASCVRAYVHACHTWKAGCGGVPIWKGRCRGCSHCPGPSLHTAGCLFGGASRVVRPAGSWVLAAVLMVTLLLLVHPLPLLHNSCYSFCCSRRDRGPCPLRSADQRNQSCPFRSTGRPKTHLPTCDRPKLVDRMLPTSTQTPKKARSETAKKNRTTYNTDANRI